jgi:hypothetical protein
MSAYVVWHTPFGLACLWCRPTIAVCKNVVLTRELDLGQGVSVFGDILTWFQKQNNFAGWFSFTLLYCLNISLFLPGIVLVLGAGFVFGYACISLLKAALLAQAMLCMLMVACPVLWVS